MREPDERPSPSLLTDLWYGFVLFMCLFIFPAIADTFS